ncbi:unnamed protein product [Musa acuminata subsp. burmannicoides]
MGRRLEKSSRHVAEDTSQTAFADKHLQIASGTIDVARKHDDEMQGLLPIQRQVPSGPNQQDPPYDRRMADWGPVVVAVVLFVLLSPGLLFQIPGKGGRLVEFGNFQTSGVSILVHAVIYFALITIFLIAVGVHVYTG